MKPHIVCMCQEDEVNRWRCAYAGMVGAWGPTAILAYEKWAGLSRITRTTRIPT